jgi:hypothetical protein
VVWDEGKYWFNDEPCSATMRTALCSSPLVPAQVADGLKNKAKNSGKAKPHMLTSGNAGVVVMANPQDTKEQVPEDTPHNVAKEVFHHVNKKYGIDPVNSAFAGTLHGFTTDCMGGVNGNCYSMMVPDPGQTGFSWQAAETQCVANRGHLASVHTEAEFHFVRKLLASACPREQAWMGLTLPDGRTQWAWVDGTPMNFEKWSNRRSNDPSERCGDIVAEPKSHSYMFDDEPCMKNLGCAVCQISGVDVAMAAAHQVAVSYGNYNRSAALHEAARNHLESHAAMPDANVASYTPVVPVVGASSTPVASVKTEQDMHVTDGKGSKKVTVTRKTAIPAIVSAPVVAKDTATTAINPAGINTVTGSSSHPQYSGIVAPSAGATFSTLPATTSKTVSGVSITKEDMKGPGERVKVGETFHQHAPTYGATAIPPSYADEIQHTTVKATPTKTVRMADGTLEQVQTGPPEAIKTRIHSIQRNYQQYQQAIKDHMQMPGVVDVPLQPAQKVVTPMRPIIDGRPDAMTPSAPVAHSIQELDTKYIPNILDAPSNVGGVIDAPIANNGLPLHKGPTVSVRGASVPKFGRLETLSPQLPAIGSMMTVKAPTQGRVGVMAVAGGLPNMPYPESPIAGFPDINTLPVKPEPYNWTDFKDIKKVEQNVALHGDVLPPAAQLAYGESIKLASKYGKYLNAEMESDMRPDANGNSHNPITRLLHNVKKQRINCKNDTDCNGNGRCNPDGTCLCNNDWLGPYCQDMDIIKLNKRCFQHPSCQHCIRDQTCGWAANLRRCMFGMVDGPEANVFDKNITQWDFQYCSGEPCRSYLTCEACTADPLCVYCHQPVPLQANAKFLPTGACIEGDSRGPLYHCPSDMSVWTYYGQGKCPMMSVHRTRQTIPKGDMYIEGATHYDTIYGPMDVPQKVVHPEGEVEEDEKQAAQQDKKEAAEVADKPATKPKKKASATATAASTSASGSAEVAADANSTETGNSTASVDDNKAEAEETAAPKEAEGPVPDGAEGAKEEEEKKKEEDAKEAEKSNDEKKDESDAKAGSGSSSA